MRLRTCGLLDLLIATIVILGLLSVGSTAYAAYPVADDPTWGFDPTWDEITLIRADLDPGEEGLCAFIGYYDDDKMDHTVYVYVVDRSADGVIEDGGEVVVYNEANGYEGVMGTKPLPEWQDWPEYKHDNLTVRMRDALGRKSDVIKLIRQVPKAGTSLPVGVNLYHIGRRIGFRKCVGAAAEATPTATPEPTPTAAAEPTSTPVAGAAWAVTEQSDARIVIELK